MTINYIELFQLIIAVVVGSFFGMTIVQEIKKLNIFCFADGTEEVLVIFYKGEPIKNQFLVKAIKMLRLIVLNLLK